MIHVLEIQPAATVKWMDYAGVVSRVFYILYFVSPGEV